MRLVVWIMALGFLGVGCHSPNGSHVGSGGGGESAAIPQVFVPYGIAPLLTTNDVLRIAVEAAVNRKYEVRNYVCEALIFELASPERSAPNRWMAHFVTHKRSPDLDFFVFVNDANGKATLEHR